MLETLQAVLAIVLIDLALSGDNALVIGMAARGLPKEQRRKAVILGGGAAVVLRIAATAVVSMLLRIPYLQLIGGLVLVAIAYRLVRPAQDNAHNIRPATGLRDAIVTITLADAAMSLENVLGVGGAAQGELWLLIFGLALSIPIVLFGSGLVMVILDRHPWAIWLGAIALLWTAAGMVVSDPVLATRLGHFDGLELIVAGLFVAVVVLARFIAYRAPMETSPQLE